MIVCVIVTYNIGYKIIEVYKSIVKQVDKIIIVDNNSDELTKYIIENIAEYDINTNVIKNKLNYGIAKALNIGIEYSKKYDTKYIITLDHDTIIEKNCVKEMLDIFNKDSNVSVVVPKVYDINKNGYITTVENSSYQYVINPIQSGAVIKISLFDEIGLFNEKLQTYYVDNDFFYRTSESGRKIIQCNTAKVLHEEGHKIEKKIAGKKFYYPNYGDYAIFYRARNYVYIKKKYKSIFDDNGRLIKDFIRILFFDKNRFKKVAIHFKGIANGYSEFRFKKKIN